MEDEDHAEIRSPQDRVLTKLILECVESFMSAIFPSPSDILLQQSIERMSSGTKMLYVSPVLIAQAYEAPQSVDISRARHLQNGYHFGPMRHNAIW